MASFWSSLTHHRRGSRSGARRPKPEPDERDLESRVPQVGAARVAGMEPSSRAVHRAKAFASWTAYQGRGVATIVRGLEAALGLVRVEACAPVPRCSTSARCRSAPRGVQGRRLPPQSSRGGRGSRGGMVDREAGAGAHVDRRLAELKLGAAKDEGSTRYRTRRRPGRGRSCRPRAAPRTSGAAVPPRRSRARSRAASRCCAASCFSTAPTR